MDIQAIAVKVFGKPWNTFSKEEKSYAEKMFSAGQSSTQNNSQNNSPTGTEKPLDPTAVLSEIGTATSTIGADLINLNANVNELINSAQQFGNKMGIGRARASELRTTIADTVPELMKLGVDEGDALRNITAIPD
jgi:hypothetical protein